MKELSPMTDIDLDFSSKSMSIAAYQKKVGCTWEEAEKAWEQAHVLKSGGIPETHEIKNIKQPIQNSINIGKILGYVLLIGMIVFGMNQC